MILEILPQEFSVCRLTNMSAIPDGFVFFGRTDNEISLVCETDKLDCEYEKREDGWRGLRVAGELDFALIGILSGITSILAAAQISVFCVSTYDTDYVLIKKECLDAAQTALTAAGYTIKSV